MSIHDANNGSIPQRMNEVNGEPREAIQEIPKEELLVNCDQSYTSTFHWLWASWWRVIYCMVEDQNQLLMSTEVQMY